MEFAYAQTKGIGFEPIQLGDLEEYFSLSVESLDRLGVMVADGISNFAQKGVPKEAAVLPDKSANIITMLDGSS